MNLPLVNQPAPYPFTSTPLGSGQAFVSVESRVIPPPAPCLRVRLWVADATQLHRGNAYLLFLVPLLVCELFLRDGYRKVFTLPS